MKEISVGKNVGLKMSNLRTIQEYQLKTRKGFSKTLNIIIEEWDKITIEFAKIKYKEEDQKLNSKIEDYKKAKVIKE